MAEKDSFAERGRSLEEEYFRRKNQELLEKMRRAEAADRGRAELGEKTGLTDPEALRQLEALGFTSDTVSLLPLVPLVQVAWAEGGVTPAERDLIVKFARARGIEDGGPADRLLGSWLDHRPAEEMFANATSLIRAMLEARGPDGPAADDLVRQSEAVAAASGGLFGINRVSGEERQLLARIAEELKHHR